MRFVILALALTGFVGCKPTVSKLMNLLVGVVFKENMRSEEDYWTRWHDGGLEKSEGEYKNGKPHGTWSYWSQTGKLLGTNQWNRGSGAVTFWHDNGQKKVEGVFQGGKEYGKWSYWSKAGKLLGTNQWNRGSGTITEWYDNGQKFRVGRYKDGEEIGKWTCWDEAGKEITCPKPN